MTFAIIYKVSSPCTCSVCSFLTIDLNHIRPCQMLWWLASDYKRHFMCISTCRIIFPWKGNILTLPSAKCCVTAPDSLGPLPPISLDNHRRKLLSIVAMQGPGNLLLLFPQVLLSSLTAWHLSVNQLSLLASRFAQNDLPVRNVPFYFSHLISCNYS